MSSRFVRGSLVYQNTVTVTTGNLAVSDQSMVVVDKTDGAATAITLPANPLNGHSILIKDGKGDAGTNNITITPASGTIDGAATYVISENYGSVILEYATTQAEWGVIATGKAVGDAELAFLNGVTAGAGAASKAMVLDANSELNGIGVIKKADVLIPTAEVLALNGTPKTLVAAPGAGVYLEFLGAYVFLDYAGVAYAADAGEDLCVRYTNASGDIVSTSIDGEEFEAAADALYIMSPVPTAPNIITHGANAPLVLHLLVGEWATGTSPLKVRTYYREIRKAALEAIA